MLYFVHKYKISPTAKRVGSLGPIYDITDTNYATRRKY
jgi:hypothetical protein